MILVIGEKNVEIDFVDRLSRYILELDFKVPQPMGTMEISYCRYLYGQRVAIVHYAENSFTMVSLSVHLVWTCFRQTNT